MVDNHHSVATVASAGKKTGWLDSRRDYKAAELDFGSILAMISQITQASQPRMEVPQQEARVEKSETRDRGDARLEQRKDSPGTAQNPAAARQNETRETNDAQRQDDQPTSSRTADAGAAGKEGTKADTAQVSAQNGVSASPEPDQTSASKETEGGPVDGAVKTPDEALNKIAGLLQSLAQGGEVDLNELRDHLMALLAGDQGGEALKQLLQGQSPQMQSAIENLNNQIAKLMQEASPNLALAGGGVDAQTGDIVLGADGANPSKESDAAALASLIAEVKKGALAEMEVQGDAVTQEAAQNIPDSLPDAFAKLVLQTHESSSEMSGDAQDGVTPQFKAAQDIVAVLQQQIETSAANNPAAATSQNSSDTGKISLDAVMKTSGVAMTDSGVKAMDDAGRTAMTSGNLPASVKASSEIEVIRQIVSKMSFRSGGDKNEIHIRLDPPSLGTVRVNVSTVGDSVRATVVTEHQAVKQMIENNLSQLRDAISEQGLNVESFTVLVGGNSGHPQGQGNEQPAPWRGGGPEVAQTGATSGNSTEQRMGVTGRAMRDASQTISIFA